MTDAKTSFDKLLRSLFELLEKDKRRPIADTIRLPLRNGGSINVAIISKLLLRPTQAFP